MTAPERPNIMPCGQALPGHVGLAPLTNTQSNPDGTLGLDELRWLEARARGGFRWVSTCAAYVSDEGKAWEGQLGIARTEHLPGLTQLADTLRGHGALSVVQLHHAGTRATLCPTTPLSAGATPASSTGRGSRAATAADLRRVTADFVAAAERAERAGFRGVEIHGANGYLFTQFLAPDSNPRTDAYGGPIEGRARFLREVTRAVRAAVSPGFAVGVRLSPIDVWEPRGLTLADSLQVGAWLAEDGADFIHLSLADARCAAPEAPGGPAVVSAFRDALPAPVALLVAGGLWTAQDVDEARGLGADVAMLGRAAMIHPDWPKRAHRAGWQPTRTPWEPEALAAAAAGPALLRYASRFPGMLTTSPPPRA